MVFSLLGCEKQQSSLHAPWAQVCNENRSTAITQKSMPEHTQRALHAGFQQHFLVFLYSSSISFCAKWGHATCVGLRGSRGEWRGDAGRQMQFVLKGNDDLNFRFAVKRWQLLMGCCCCCCLSFSWSHIVQPRSNKLDSSLTWLKFLAVLLFTRCLSAKQTESGIVGTVTFMAFRSCRWMDLWERW